MFFYCSYIKRSKYVAALFSLNVDLTSLLSQVFFSISTVGTIAILDYMSSTNIYICISSSPQKDRTASMYRHLWWVYDHPNTWEVAVLFIPVHRWSGYPDRSFHDGKVDKPKKPSDTKTKTCLKLPENGGETAWKWWIVHIYIFFNELQMTIGKTHGKMIFRSQRIFLLICWRVFQYICHGTGRGTQL
jgi:hypothetical protein